MKVAPLAFVIALVATPVLAGAHAHHGLFGAVRHGHPINAWTGSHHLRLR